jgi:2-oxoglutarate ferredoxin oxidoreductase subunit beta
MNARNPRNQFLRTDRMPHIWCPGCGLGTVVNCFISAIENDSELSLDQICAVSGIGCTGRIAGYLKVDSFHTTHGRPIPFATGLKLANPKMKVVVFSGDGDLFAIGGNHFIHAARRNMNLTIICVNNFTYGMTGGQVTPTTPMEAFSATTPYGNIEEPFNLPFLADCTGAVYVARWTVFHVRQAARAMHEAIHKNGFSFVEIISPCPTLYGRRNKFGDGLKMMEMFKESSVIENEADTRDVALDFRGKIICGKFVDREKTSYLDMYNIKMAERFGPFYEPYEGVK